MKKNMIFCLFVFCFCFCGLPDEFFLTRGQTETNNFFPWPHYYLVCKQTQASLAKWLSVRLRTKWLWVRIPLPSLKLQIQRLLRARSSLTFRQTLQCGFTLKLVRDMIITSPKKKILYYYGSLVFLRSVYSPVTNCKKGVKFHFWTNLLGLHQVRFI